MISSTLALVVLLQVNHGLDVALAAQEEGREVKVSRAVAAEAASAVGNGQLMRSEELELHVRVAMQGGAHAQLAPTLGALIAKDGPVLEAALRAADALGRGHRAAIVEALGPVAERAELAGRPSLVYACYDADAPAARGAIAIVAAAAPEAQVRDLLLGLLESPEHAPRAALALEVLLRRSASPELFETLLELAADAELSAGVAEPLGAALAAFIDRRPELAARLLEAVRREPTSALLGGLVATPPESWEESIGAVLLIVDSFAQDLPSTTTAGVRLVVGALQAGTELRADRLLPSLPRLCQPTVPMPVRMAALRALGSLGGRDARVVDVLLSYLDEREPMGRVAYESLCLRTGAKLPPRSILWKDWRARTTLPVMTPEQHAERLTKERMGRHQQRMPAGDRSAVR